MFPPYAGSDELVPPKRSSDRALLVLAAACSAPTSNRRLPAVEARRAGEPRAAAYFGGRAEHLF